MNSLKMKYSTSKKSSKQFEIEFCIVSKDRFEVQVNYNEKVIEYMKTIPSRKYDFNTRNWNFLLSDYNTLVKGLNNFEGVKVNGFPQSISKIFRSQFCGHTPPLNAASLVSEEQFLKVDSKIRDCLFPFQKDGVKFMIGNNGRCLLADDMGLGKTIQALGVASYYRHEWPLLVICPSSVKLAWRDQMIKWLSEPLNITVINNSLDINGYNAKEPTCNSVLLISYDLVSKIPAILSKKNFQVVIMDESHFIKDYKSARSKSCVPLLKKARRAILLSGTPALSRPAEMFSQIDCVNPTIYNGYFTEFGNRYCDPKPTAWGNSYLGSSNMPELNVILDANIMLRRIKSDVLPQLPAKRREVIILAPEFLKRAALKNQSEINHFENLKGCDRHRELLKYFHETGKAKVDAIKNYIDDLLESTKKTLFFAHHTEVLNNVEQQLIKKKVGYIRIDGKTSAVQKRELAEKFQFDDSVQIAVLSIMAAGTGINLTAANLVVFGELFWNPGILLQAENRCHRIGQQDMVNVHYLVAENTADDFIWPLVQHKLQLLSEVGLNKENFKNSETMRLEESFSEKDMKSAIMMDCFEKDFIEDTGTPMLENDQETESVAVQKCDHESFTDENIDWMMTDFDEETEGNVAQNKVEEEKQNAVLQEIFEEENFDWVLNDSWTD